MVSRGGKIGWDYENYPGRLDDWDFLVWYFGKERSTKLEVYNEIGGNYSAQRHRFPAMASEGEKQ